MSRERKLIKNTMIYGIGNFVVKLAAFIILPIYTAYFTTAEYGKWDLIMTTTSMIVPFVTFELVSATYRWLITAENENERIEIFTTGLISISKNTIIFSIIGFILCLIFRIQYAEEIISITVLSIIFSYFQQSCRGIGNNKLFILSGIMNTVINIISNLVFMFIFNMRIESFIYSTCLSYIVVSLMLWNLGDLKKYLDFKKKSDGLYKEFIKYSIPLIPSAISWWVMNVSDRYIIAYYLGSDANGIYAVANKIPSLIVMLSSAFFLAWKDNVVKEYASEDKEIYYSKIFKYYFRLMVCGVICLISSSQVIMMILVSESFAIAWKYTGFLLVGTLFNTFSQFWGAGYQASKKTKSILITSIWGAVINILINLVLVKYIGLYASAVSTAISFAVMWIARVVEKDKGFKININYNEFILLGSILSLAIVLSFMENIIINAIIIVVTLFIFLILNKNIIFKIRVKNH